MGCIKFYGFNELTNEWILIGETDLRLDIEHYVISSIYKKFRYYFNDVLLFSIQKES